MQTFQLYHRDQNLLFAGDYRTLRECVEDALRDGIDLRGVNLAHADLSEINLDGANLHGASFAHANLTGANMSEASCVECTFAGAALFNACFCYSNLSHSDFSDAAFGGTDLAGATLVHCLFSGASTLGLNLSDCATLDGALYRTPQKSCRMSQTPLVVTGLSAPLVLFDEDVMVGTSLYHCAQSIWRREHPTGGPQEPLPHALFKTVALLKTLRETSSPYGCIAAQKST